MNEPKPHVMEVSSDVKEFSDAMRELKAVNLIRMCDKHILIPKVKCPWGCCQFLNLASEKVPFDIVYHEFLENPVGLYHILLWVRHRGGWMV